ncbi:Uncharacterized membrane protein YeaQ/YmgE, transglycosylase-associated protein family [Mycobacterium rhizamassiliense]|uniref:Uncharacterized membrane protein YeaQ/YmgE, transglycosylase-associated protein family n=2 Tax=Mycobacterium rhizamassiliense TaxID=1841860 RepID=A0A2U3NVZ9_9MYCO|nr:Uncharacterized membrane protein YeaQ/YmgE, transglycosylase-associated protein family [Mycobacterium rhizamassiliense]
MPAQTRGLTKTVGGAYRETMLTLGVIGWIIIGGLAGWVGSKLMGTDAQMGVVLNIAVGIIGGLIGGFLLRGFGVDVAGGGLLFSFMTCLAGAVILLGIVKVITGGRASR